VVQPLRADPWRAVRRRRPDPIRRWRRGIRLGLLGLQFQIDFIEGGERLADLDGLTDFNEALCDLAWDPKAHVGSMRGLMVADKAPLRRGGLIMHGSDQNGRPGNGLFGRDFVAAGQRDHRQRQHRSGQEPVITR